MMDADSSGNIDPKEIAAVLAGSNLSKAAAARQGQVWFDRFNVNHDRKVSLSQLRSQLKVLGPGHSCVAQPVQQEDISVARRSPLSQLRCTFWKGGLCRVRGVLRKTPSGARRRGDSQLAGLVRRTQPEGGNMCEIGIALVA